MKALLVLVLAVAAVVLVEEALPRIIRAVKRRRQERARAIRNAPSEVKIPVEGVAAV